MRRLFAVGLLLLCAQAFGGASVSGGTLTITDGANPFGSKTSAAPYFFQRFTTLSQNDTPTTAGYFDLADTLGTGPAYVDLSEGHGGGGSLLCVTDVGDPVNAPTVAENFWHIGNYLPAGTKTVYRAFWQKVHHVSGSTVQSMQLKSVRSGKLPEYSGIPVFKSSQYINSPDGSWFNLNREYINQAGTTIQSSSMDSAPSPNWHAEDWNFVETLRAYNTSGNSDGYYWYKINGITLLNESGFSMTTSDYDQEYAYLIPGMDAANGTVWNIRFASDYLDTTPSRVIVTDSAAYSNSTNFQPQSMSSWSAGTLSGTFIQGTFANGATAYAHVFDSTDTDHVYSFTVPGAGGDATASPTGTTLTVSSSSVSATGDAVASVSGTTVALSSGVASASAIYSFESIDRGRGRDRRRGMNRR